MATCVFCLIRYGDHHPATMTTADGEPVCESGMEWFNQQLPIFQARDAVKAAEVAHEITPERAKEIRMIIQRAVVAAGGQCAYRVAQRELATNAR